MAYEISEKKCIGCGSCKVSCPAEAISENKDKYKIDPEKCISCGTCASVCPVEAPSPEGED